MGQVSRFIDVWADRDEPVITTITAEELENRLMGWDRQDDWVREEVDREGRPFRVSWHSWGPGYCLSILEE